LEQIVQSSQLWAILAPLLIVVFLTGFIFGARRAKTKVTDKLGIADSRLHLARDQIADDRKAISHLQTDIDQLRTLIKAKARRTVLEPIVQDAEVRAQALAMSNRTTDHILTAKTLAIRNEAPLVPKA
jgi:hypothetical protein